ncbi:IS1096 element passenger TnpR family protein [Desulfonema magnum]|uniref:Plasmid pRiA4b Orf3-like domain-containing protein n=1 Tax=Desulfonema magnum TaxID=45655 RepID=A0A975BGU2_9BACT|nr:hypothetical protein [Desulfonema magnum]QTA85252.1 Uncharacterized protein dnm_012570 [Desulfonema magnum]
MSELFGLISVRHGKPEKGKGWRIKDIQRTAFGDALLKLLPDSSGNFEYFLRIYDSEASETIGELQPLIQPFFPEWRKNLEIPEHEFQEGTFVFKVSLGTQTWRRIAMPGKMTLDSFSTQILNAFDFDHDHLYAFTLRNRFGVSVEVTHPYMDEGISAAEFFIGDLPLQSGETMVYLYDFGDNWEFSVMLEKIDLENSKMKKPALLESHGEAPEQYDFWDEDDYE